MRGLARASGLSADALARWKSARLFARSCSVSASKISTRSREARHRSRVVAVTMITMAGRPLHYLCRTCTSHATATTPEKAALFRVCFAAALNYASFEAWKSSFAK
jgi:hypothetical protein